jgi:UDP-N-acetylmuramate--alanine ligase
VLNALAATAIGLELGIPFPQIRLGLASFEGVGRRLEWKGEFDGVEVFDDYGHHPTEIRATLAALRERFPSKRLVVLFQPHRYSRTQALHQEFGKCFGDASQVYVLDIYPAGEDPIAGVSSELILQSLRKNHPVASAWSTSQPVARLAESLRSGDVVLTIGAGDVWKLGEQLLRNATHAQEPT